MMENFYHKPYQAYLRYDHELVGCRFFYYSCWFVRFVVEIKKDPDPKM
jgi:hypothetical protein